MAVPSWQVPPIHGTGGGLLSAYLTKQGPKFAREVVPFELLQAKDTGGGLEAEYAGLASVAVITMELNGAPYVLMYAGVGATPLQKPAVFDDLLKPQLKVAEEFSNGKLTTASAGRVFSLFTSVPVLNKALENVAALRKPEPKDITQAVHAAAQGYISDDVAETLGKSLQRCLDKVSPTYSSRAWRLVVTPLALLVFLMASHIMDPMFVWRATAPLFSPFAALLGYEFNLIEVLYRSWSGFWQWLPLGYVLQIGLTHMSVAVCLLVLALPLIWLLSALFTSHGIKKLPPQYRRKPAHMRPFKKALVVQLAASALGSAVLMLIGS